MMPKSLDGFIFQCDDSFSVQTIVLKDQQNDWIKEHVPFCDLVDPGSTNKVTLFLNTIIEDKFACAWEVFIPQGRTPIIKILTGFKEGKNIWVFGARSRHDLSELLISVLNNQLVVPMQDKSILNACVFETLRSRGREETDDDLSKINTELMVIQRELSKRKAELEQINLQIQNKTDYFEGELIKRNKDLIVSEARFRGVFEAATTGLVIMALDGKIIEMNPAIRKILALDFRTKEFNNVSELPYYSGFSEYEQLLLQLVSGEKDFQLTRHSFQDDKKQEKWADIRFFLVKDQTGSPVYVINLVEDITEQLKAQAALIRSEKLSIAGQLAASLAHEVNNPLQVIIGNLGLAQESLRSREPIDRYLSISLEELRRIARIIAQLRDINKPLTKAKHELLNLNQILENAFVLTNKKLSEKNIRLEKHIEADIPAIHGSGDQFQQIFLNLILNAIDAMPQGGYLIVRMKKLRTDPKAIQITFQDNGVGIKDQDQDRIFEPFFTTKQDGLGLGLFIISDIIKSYGGRIDIKGIENKGTTVQILLPVG